VQTHHGGEAVDRAAYLAGEQMKAEAQKSLCFFIQQFKLKIYIFNENAIINFKC
jgi:hypothetical protein